MAAAMKLPSPEQWQRLGPLLDELLDLPPGQRGQSLVQLDQTDPALASELRDLLATAPAAEQQGFLSGPIDPALVPAPGSATGAETLAATEVGSYTLESPLGEGGSGSVWRARRSDGRLGQPVAVKLLHLALLGQGAAQRFRREGAILARLSHPHIAGLLDAGVTPAGQPYLVLELVQGEPIDNYCKRLQLDVDARLQLFLDVLSAVGHAHRHLVVHRDIKPGNVMVTADGQVKLLDFGIAKLLDSDEQGAQATALTREGGRALTPAYAAPEQFDGGEVTTATDVYALGVLLFQLLVDQHPTAPAGTGAAAMIRAVMTTEPVRPSRAVLRSSGLPDPRGTSALARPVPPALRRLSRRLAGDLDTIVARMLRKAPAERYPTVTAVADDIRRHLADQPISARPDSWRYRAAKFVRRHRAGVAAATLAVLAVVAGVIGTVSQARIAQTERDRALRELTYAESANEFIGNVLTEGSRRAQSSVGLLDQASALLDEQFGSSPALRARLQLMLATMYGEMREERKALVLLDQAAALQGSAAATSLTPSERSHIDCLRSALRQDLAGLNRALDRLAAGRAEADDARQVQAICLTRRSVLHKQQGRLGEAESDARAALVLLDGSTPGRQLAVIHARRELASAIGNQGANAEAAAQWRALLADLATHGRANSVYAAAAYNNLFVRLSTAGQEKEAFEAQQRAIAIWIRLQGEDQLDPQLWANLASSLDLLGRSDEAIQTIAKALARIRPDTPLSAKRSTWVRGALLMCRARRQPECRELTQAAEASLPRDLPGDHFEQALRAYVQAAGSSAVGDLTAERAALREAVRIAEASPVRSGLLPGALTRLAEVELGLGDAGAALDASTRAEAAAATLSQGFAHNSLIGRALTMRGRAQIALGRSDAARRSLEEALAHLRTTTGADSPLSAEVEQWLARAGH